MLPIILLFQTVAILISSNNDNNSNAKQSKTNFNKNNNNNINNLEDEMEDSDEDSELIDMSPTAESEAFLGFEGKSRFSRISVLLPDHELHGLIAPLLLKGGQISTAASSLLTSPVVPNNINNSNNTHSQNNSLKNGMFSHAAIASISPLSTATAEFGDEIAGDVGDNFASESIANESINVGTNNSNNISISTNNSNNSNDNGNNSNMETIKEESLGNISPWSGIITDQKSDTSDKIGNKEDKVNENESEAKQKENAINAVEISLNANEWNETLNDLYEAPSPREGTILHYLTFT